MNISGPILHHRIHDDLPWQWHMQKPFIDDVTGKPTTYIAGFKDVESARTYGELKEYC